MNVLNIDTPYGREVDALLTPDVIEGLQRAASTLGAVLPVVKDAMDIMRPLQEATQDSLRRRYANGEKIPVEDDMVFDALRDRTAWGPAIDLTFAILEEIQRVAY